MKKFLTCTAISAVIMLSGCTFLKNNNGIVKVNNTIITQAQFDEAFDKTIDNSIFKAFGGADNFKKTDDNIMYNIFKEKVMNELIVKTLLNQEIEKRGIKVTKEDVENEMKSVVDKVGSKEELNTLLKQRGISNAEFTEDLRTQVEIKKLINSIQKISISDSDAQKYYNTHPSEFKHGEQVRASHILISADTLQIIRDLKLYYLKLKQILITLHKLPKRNLMTEPAVKEEGNWVSLQKKQWFQNLPKQLFL